MSRLAWQEQVAALSRMLDDLEARGAPYDPETALPELKSALDDLRLRTWGLLSAIHADDPHAFQEQFRTRRGIEMCRALTADLGTGKLRSSQPDLPALGEAARDLAATVKEATRKPAKRRSKRSR